jgi:hypothetical protein
MPYTVKLPPVSPAARVYGSSPMSEKPVIPVMRGDARLAYQSALRRRWSLVVKGPHVDLSEVECLHQQILRLIDEVGEPLATRLRRQWARQWHEETGVCPFCGETGGPYCDPDREGKG